MKTILAVAGGALALFLTIAMFGGAGWTHPPMANKQTGFRGFVSLEQDKHPGDMKATAARYLALMKEYLA